MQDHVDAARDRHRALAAPDALARQANRGQRRRAGRVDGETRAGEVEDVGDAVGDRPVRRVRPGQLPAFPTGRAELAVRAVHQADEDTGTRLPGVLAEVPGRLQQVPRRLQEQPLLRVDGHRVAGQDTEEPRVEKVDTVEEAAPPAVGALRGTAFRVEVAAPVPPGHGYLGDGRGTRGEVAPG